MVRVTTWLGPGEGIDVSLTSKSARDGSAFGRRFNTTERQCVSFCMMAPRFCTGRIEDDSARG